MKCTEFHTLYPDYSRLPLSSEITNTDEWSEWMDHSHVCMNCSDWSLEQRVKSRGFDPGDYPCVHIANQVTATCKDHPDPYDCPDILVAYFARFYEYSLACHPGGSPKETILFCPWCGKKLPKSKRDKWFDELNKLGFDDPDQQDIPAKYWSGEWHREST